MAERLSLVTVEEFDRWLAGQIMFGVSRHKDTPFLRRFLHQKTARLGCKPVLDAQLSKLRRRFPAAASAAEYQQEIANIIARGQRPYPGPERIEAPDITEYHER